MVLESMQKLPNLGLEHSRGKRLDQKSQTELTIGGEVLVSYETQAEKEKISKPKGLIQL